MGYFKNFLGKIIARICFYLKIKFFHNIYYKNATIKRVIIKFVNIRFKKLNNTLDKFNNIRYNFNNNTLVKGVKFYGP